VVRRARTALALAGLAACSGASTVTLAPIVDTPPAGSTADPFPTLETLTIEVAGAGDPNPLVLHTFARGQALELPGVPFLSDLVVHLTGRVGGAEVAYGRTCTFNLQAGQTPPTPHLWFARTVKWADSELPPSPTRTGGAAWAAAGSGVFVGGTAGASGAALTEIDRFDPVDGVFLDVGATVASRTGAALAPLPSGAALLIGGLDTGTSAPAGYLELVDPLAPAASLRVTRTDDVRLGLVGAAAATLSDGNVVVMGGAASAGGPPVGSVFVVQSPTGAIDIKQVTATMITPRAGHTLTRLSDDLGAPVLVVGGVDATGALVQRAELYKPLREAFADPGLFAPPLNVPRVGHAALRMPDGSVIILGGVDATNMPVRQMELFSLDAGFVADATAVLPPEAGVVDFAVTSLPDGRVLLTGGRTAPGGAPTTTAFIISVDPLSLEHPINVVPTDSLSTPRAGHQAVLLCDGTVLLVGGTDEPTAPSERYNPPSLDRR
jgi:hypothetical protein